MIQFAIYSSPPLKQLFRDGEVKNPNMWRAIDHAYCVGWITQRMADFEGDFKFLSEGTFADELRFLTENVDSQNDLVYVHKQVQLALDREQAAAQVEERLQKILELGGEGVVAARASFCGIPIPNGFPSDTGTF
jgi:hypothetical protein